MQFKEKFKEIPGIGARALALFSTAARLPGPAGVSAAASSGFPEATDEHLALGALALLHNFTRSESRFSLGASRSRNSEFGFCSKNIFGN